MMNLELCAFYNILPFLDNGPIHQELCVNQTRMDEPNNNHHSFYHELGVGNFFNLKMKCV